MTNDSLQKYIFLDIDGPLNTGRNVFLDPEQYGHHFDNEAVGNLREIIDQTGATIVISSSWRHMGLSRIQEIWREWNLPGEVIGCTPGEWGEAETFDTRGQEIKRWLDDNATEPYQFVIIDDFTKEEAAIGQEKFWITVNPHCGISKENADWLSACSISILNIASMLFFQPLQCSFYRLIRQNPDFRSDLADKAEVVYACSSDTVE